MTESQASTTVWTPTGERRRTHPITPLVTGARSAPIGLVIAVGVGRNLGSGFLVTAVLLGVVIAFLAAAFAFLGWQRFTFWFDDDGDLRVDSGVLNRKESRLQLSRLQAVDLVQPLMARLAGMAEVRVEVAGAGESRATIAYLTLADAQALRSEVIARAAGVVEDAGEAPEEVLHVVPSDLLLKALLLRGATLFIALTSIAVVIVVALNEGPSALGLLVVTGGIPAFQVVGEFTRFFDFTIAASPDGIRLRSGLLQTRAQTVPPGRVHAIAIVEPLLWRRFGWVRVTVNLAAGGAGDDAQVQGVLLPVGTRAEAHAVIERLLPGAFSEDVEWRGVPRRARWRAPLQQPRLGVAFSTRAFLTRSGWVTRSTTWVPVLRAQSIGVEQGPWQRRLGLASVRVDTVPGAVKLVGLHREAGDARSLADQLAERAARARAQDLPDRWMRGAALGAGETIAGSTDPANSDDLT